MEKLKTLKIVVWMCIAIMAVQMGILLLAIKPASAFLWIGFGVVAIMCLYLARISLGLISELKDKEEEIERLERSKKQQN